MDEYIKREALIKKIDEGFDKTDPCGEEQIGFLKCRRIAREIPAEDVAPMVHGTWRYDGEDWFCNRCNHNALGDFDTGKYDLSRFCPNCGTKMDGDNNG